MIQYILYAINRRIQNLEIYPNNKDTFQEIWCVLPTAYFPKLSPCEHSGQGARLPWDPGSNPG